MKKFIRTSVIMSILGLLLSTTVYASEVESLRGNIAIDEESSVPTVKKNIRDRDPIPRNYVQQPPIIPHKIKGYKINLKFNKCLTCHSWANYKTSGATKVSLTHFEGRDGDALSNVSARRYFCTQCHVRQTDTSPLVENTFIPVIPIHQ